MKQMLAQAGIALVGIPTSLTYCKPLIEDYIAKGIRSGAKQE